MHTISAKQKHMHPSLQPDVLLMLRMQFHQLESVGLYMESDIRFTNRSNLYVIHEGSPDCISLKKFTENGNSLTLVQFYCETGQIDYNMRLLREEYPGRAEEQIWMTILELLTRVEQSFLTNDQWMYKTQINHGTRRALTDFHRLGEILADGSRKPIVLRGVRQNTYTMRKEGDHLAFYSAQRALVLRVSAESFELGPEFSSTTDFDTVLRSIVESFRPLLLAYRDNIAERLKPLKGMLGYLESEWQMFVNHATSAAMAADPSAPLPKIPEFDLKVEGYGVRRTNEHWVITLQTGLGIREEGHIYFDLSNRKLRAMPSALDYLNNINFDMKGLYANQKRIELEAQQHVVKTFVDVLEAKAIDRLGLTKEEYEKYSKAFIIAKENHYAKDFETFVRTLKAVL